MRALVLLLLLGCQAPDRWHLFGGYLDLDDGDVHGKDIDQAGPFLALGVSGSLGEPPVIPCPTVPEPRLEPEPAPELVNILEAQDDTTAWLIACVYPVLILLRSLGVDLGSKVHGKLRRKEG